MVDVNGQGAVSGSVGQGWVLHQLSRNSKASVPGSESGFAPNVRVLRAFVVQDTGISDSKR